MKAKLIKAGDHYDLYYRDEVEDLIIGFASTDGTFERKLSLKKCQEIERGYDLDDLAMEECNNPDLSWENDYAREKFKAGFQKALAILGDKKFNEVDMINFSEFVSGKYINQYKFLRDKSLKGFFSTDEILKEYQSLQQTEWDVEIEMDILNEYNQPKLDADGWLILKRIP